MQHAAENGEVPNQATGAMPGLSPEDQAALDLGRQMLAQPPQDAGQLPAAPPQAAPKQGNGVHPALAKVARPVEELTKGTPAEGQ